MSNPASALSTIATSGWLVRSLGQLADGRWHCVLWLYDEDGWYETPTAISADLTLALTQAFASIASAKHFTYQYPSDSELVAPEFSLSALGLIPKPTFTSPLRRKL